MALLLLNSCATAIIAADLNLNSDIQTQSQLLNLSNFTGEGSGNFFRQSQNIVGRDFFDTRGEEYGYFAIQIGSHVQTAPIYWLYLTIGSIGLGVPWLVGFPVDANDYTLTAHLYIFDSNGDLVQRFNETARMHITSGIFYGHRPHAHRRASRIFSGLFENLFMEANSRSREINEMLLLQGPIRPDTRAAAQTKISAFLRGQ